MTTDATVVPKKRHSKSKVGRRRSQLGLKKVALRTCAVCGSPTLPHKICPQCGAHFSRSAKGRKGREIERPDEEGASTKPRKEVQ